MAREFLRFTPETVWGTYNASNPHTIVQLDQNNSFTMRPKPIPWEIRAAGGYNRRWQKGSSKTEVKGNLKTLLYGSQVAAFASWILPTGSPLNLTSCTIDHCLRDEEATSAAVYRRYLGALVQQADFTGTENDQLFRLALQLVAQQPAEITSSDFAEPAASAYPIDPPYTLEMASGGYTFWPNNLTTATRAGFESISLTIKNLLDTRFFESQFISAYRWCGRDVDWKTKFKYAFPVDRATFEAIQSSTMNVLFQNGVGQVAVASFVGGTGYTDPKATVAGTGSGAVLDVIQSGGVITDVVVLAPGALYTGTPTATLTDPTGTGGSITLELSPNDHSISFNCMTNNFISDVADDLPLDKIFLQEITSSAFYDVSNTNDFTMTVV